MGVVLVGICLLAQDDREVAAALEQFRSAFSSPSAAARAAAVNALARTRHEKVLAKLAALVVAADETIVRVAAVRGIGDFKELKGKAATILLNALPPNARQPEVRAAIFESLGKLDEEAALPTIHAGFREKDCRSAKAAIAAAGALRGASSMDPLVELMKDLQTFLKKGQSGGYVGPKGAGEEGDSQQRLRDLLKEAVGAVQKITGETWSEPYEWEIWWRRHKATFKGPR